MSWLDSLIAKLEEIFGEGAHVALAPTPTLRQLAVADSSIQHDTAANVPAHEIPADPKPVVALPGEATLVSIIKAHRANFENPLKGSVIVAPTDAEVEIEAQLLDMYSINHQVPVEFLAAAMCQESLFSCNCRNGNYLGANPHHTNEGTDWGPGQVNGANLPSLIPSCNGDWGCLVAKITSPQYAIPAFCANYDALLTWADHIIDRTDKSTVWAKEREAVYAGGSSVDPKWQNAYWLAALAYNRGRLGALAEVAAGQVVPHPDHVATYCNAFSDTFGRPHIMPDANGLNL